ncbi:MAG: glutathione S-transferase N-terminal domain-containing protein, partial [Methylotenera sp.]
MALPILYSYRRCPYAMRARMALKLANIDVEIREISLREKPAHMLQVSPKGTVPVLVLQDGSVIEQSLEIMQWALKTHALQTNIHAASRASVLALISENDDAFKCALDAYKYPERYPNKTQSQHRADGAGAWPAHSALQRRGRRALRRHRRTQRPGRGHLGGRDLLGRRSARACCCRTTTDGAPLAHAGSRRHPRPRHAEARVVRRCRRWSQ